MDTVTAMIIESWSAIMPTWKLKLPITTQVTSGTGSSWCSADISEISAQMENTAETAMAVMVM